MNRRERKEGEERREESVEEAEGGEVDGYSCCLPVLLPYLSLL